VLAKAAVVTEEPDEDEADEADTAVDFDADEFASVALDAE
jgi:hypothetical protein